MLNYLAESTLKCLFLAENTVGRFSPDRQPLFSALADVFLLSAQEREYLQTLLLAPELQGIESEHDYHQYRRMQQYLSLNGRAHPVSPDLDKAIDLKGNAFTLALQAGLMLAPKEACPVACDHLIDAAGRGKIPALIVLGVLQSEGIVFQKDVESGRDKVVCAAEWGSEGGLFAALHYDEAHRERHLAGLNGCLVRIGHAEVRERVRAQYGVPAEGKRSAYALLERAFQQGSIRRDVYNPLYARLIYSEILGARDKETLLFASNPQLCAEASALPLKLGRSRAQLCARAPEVLRPEHREEGEAILRALGNSDLRGLATFRPLCLASDSRFMLGHYAAWMGSCFEGAHIERFEIGDLADYEWEPTKNNVFVSSCDEDAFNLYLLSFCGEIQDKAFDAAKLFLQSSKRRNYRLVHPNVTLDLSGVLPIVLSDKENANRLKHCCDVVSLAPLSEQEKRLLLPRVVGEKGALYGVREIRMQDGLAEQLAGYDVDEVVAAIDAVVRVHRAERLCLTEALVLAQMSSVGANKSTFGFGGGHYE